MSELSPVQRALLAVERLKAKLDEPIAVVGIGCRFPGGVDSPESFWRLLIEGRDGVGEVPAGRWDEAALAASGLPGVRRGGFLEGIDRFDAAFFGVSPREAAAMDPQQRLVLEVAWEALEDAGMAADRIAGSRTGVFLGGSSNEYAWTLFGGEGGEVEAHAATGASISILANRLSYALDLVGPSLVVDTACSSSLVAIHLACRSLRAGDCRTALAGGVNLTLLPKPTIALARFGMLSPDGRCKTFDASADGYVRGEGCGVVVLERLSDAIASGRRILAVVRGSAVNQDGRSTGLTAPNPTAQRAVIRRALEEARVDPASIGYVETHGTGTALGDPIEVESLAAVLGTARPEGSRIALGAVKTNLGHLEPAAGIAGFVKAVLVVHHGVVPPNLHFRRLNPHVRLDGTPFVLPVESTPFPAPDRPRRAAVSSFGFGGTNAHAILEEAPAATEPTASDRPVLLVLSARTPAALDLAAARLARHLETRPGAPLSAVARTLANGRSAFEERLAIVAGSSAEAARRLGSGEVRRGRAAREPRIAFLYTGQGSQYAGMGRDLDENEPAFRAALDECEAALGAPLRPILFPAAGEVSRLDRTEHTQPALVAIEIALTRALEARGIRPAATIGHSVGEIAAAWAAGVLDLAGAVRFAAARGRLMQSLPETGEMIALATDEARVAVAIAPWRDRVSIAAINAPDEVVASGEREAVRALAAALAAEGVRGRSLATSHAFHSPLVEPILDDLERAASGLSTSKARIRFVSNLTGALDDGSLLARPEAWRRHAREPVRFAGGLAALAALGIDAFVEIGPRPILLGLARRAMPDAKATFVPTLRPGGEDRRGLLDAVAELFVLGARVDDPDRGPPISLPTYPFQRERHWAGPAASRTIPRAWIHEVVRRPAPGCQVEGLPGDSPAGTVYVAALDRPAEALVADVIEIVRSGPSRLRLVVSTARSIEHGALRGLGRVIALERPEIWGGLIDLDDPADEALVAREIALGSDEDDVSCSGGERSVARLVRSEVELPEASFALRPDATYLVTGGLGGLGLATARWLVERGARHLALVSRREPAGPVALGEARVETIPADVSREDDVRRVLDRIRDSMPPLAGIVHAAGVLDDGALDAQTPERVERVFAGKVAGARHLDRLTRGTPLDFFVLYSSSAGVHGSPGQGPYAAANAWLDQLARSRRAEGLPATSIAWGPWEGAGMAAAARGISPAVGLEILGRVLLAGASGLAVIPVGDAGEAPAFAALDRPFFAEVRPRAPTRRILDQLLAGAPEARLERLRTYVRDELARALSLAPGAIPVDANLLDLGLDSVMAMQVVQACQRDLALTLYPRDFYERPTLEGFAGRLAAEVERRHGAAPPARSTDPVFLLSAPRSGSTLLRVMLAGHPDLFSPPELHLLPFDAMAGRERALAGSWLGEGLQRAVMELWGLDAPGSRRLLDEWIARDLPIEDVYRRLAQRAGGRRLVDKSPSYAASPETLARAQALFPQARFLLLVRHPAAAIESFVRNRMERVIGAGEASPLDLAERVWTESNANALDLFERLPAGLRLVVRYEDLVRDPERIGPEICRFLGIPFDRALLAPYEGSRMTDGVHEASMPIGDPAFLSHDRIEPSLADAWRNARLPRPLGEATLAIARRLGYDDGRARGERIETTIRIRDLPLCVSSWGPGDGRPIVCLHGLLDHGAAWDAVATRLAGRGWRVLAPDLRGHGRSGHASPEGAYRLVDFAADADAVVRATGDGPIVLVGHSMGAAVALLYAAARPERVRSLVLIESLSLPPRPPAELLAAELDDLAAGPPEPPVFPDVETAARRLGRPHALESARRLTEPCPGGVRWRHDPRLVARTGLRLESAPLDAILAAIPIPITWIHGDSSGTHPAPRPGDRVHRLPGGHHLHLDNPAALAPLIGDGDG